MKMFGARHGRLFSVLSSNELDALTHDLAFGKDSSTDIYFFGRHDATSSWVCELAACVLGAISY